MAEKGLIGQELEILHILVKGPCSIRELAQSLRFSKSWCSRCVSHLARLGLVRLHKDGRRSRVEVDNGPVGNAFMVLVAEDPLLDLTKVLTGQGLALLPYLMPPGSTVEHMCKRSGRTSRSVRSYLRRWRNLGVIREEKRKYSIHPFHPYLIKFVKIYSEQTLVRTIKAIGTGMNILWQDRDECLVSTTHDIENKLLLPAGPTALSELGEDIVYSHRYYLFSPVKRRISLEEAYIQAILIDRVEPRLKRLLVKGVKAGTVDTDLLLSFSERYGIKDVLMEVLSDVPEKSA